MVVYVKKANEEVISLFKSTFDVQKLCEEVSDRIETPANYGTHKCNLRSLGVKRTNFGKDYLEIKFKTTSHDTISHKMFLTSEYSLDEAIRFVRDLLPTSNVYSYNCLKNIKLDESDKSSTFLVHYAKDPNEVERVFVFGRG